MSLDAPQLAAPVAFEHCAPFMNASELIGVGSIHGLPAFTTCRDQPDVAQHLQVLRDRWLIEFQRRGDLRHRMLLAGNELEDVTAAWLGDGIERIRGGRGARHTDLYIPIWEYVN